MKNVMNWLRRTALATALMTGLAGSARPQSSAAEARPRFEVVSIRPNSSGDAGFLIGGPGSSAGRFIAKNVPLRVLIRWAYGLKDFQVSEGPNWINSRRYDIQATVNDSVVVELQKLPRDEQGRHISLMVQFLLADRFQLRVKRSTKEAPIYALFVTKGGPRFSATTLASVTLTVANSSGPPSGHSMKTGIGEIEAIGEPISHLAGALSDLREIGRIVQDETGLDGFYDFTVRWAPDEAQPLAPSEKNSGPPTSGSVSPSIFTALQEQLGLKLQAQKGRVDVLVIDHVEEPSAN